MCLLRERSFGFQEESSVWQLNASASLCRSRAAVSSVFFVTAARGRLQLDSCVHWSTNATATLSGLPTRTADVPGVRMARSWLMDVQMLQRIAERN